MNNAKKFAPIEEVTIADHLSLELNSTPIERHRSEIVSWLKKPVGYQFRKPCDAELIEHLQRWAKRDDELDAFAEAIWLFYRYLAWGRRHHHAAEVERVLRSLAGAKGLAFVLDVCLQLDRVRPLMLSSGGTAVAVHDGSSLEHVFVELRRFLAYAPDAEFARARSLAEERWPTASGANKVLLAMAFPSNEGWGNGACEVWKGCAMPALLATGAGAESKNEVLRRIGEEQRWGTGEYAATLVDMDGLAIAEGLAAAYLGTASRHRRDQDLARALACLECAATAEAFARCFDTWKKQEKLETQFFEQNAALAVPALSALDAERHPRAHAILAELQAAATAASDTGSFIGRDELPEVFGDLPWRQARKRPKKAPHYWTPMTWEQLAVEGFGTRALAPELLEDVSVMMQESSERLHPRLEALLALVSEESLAAFARDAARAFFDEGKPGDAWLLVLLAECSDPVLVDWLEGKAIWAFVRSKHKHAYASIDALRRIGDEHALGALGRLLRRTDYPRLADHARAALGAIAAAEGCTAEDLLDRLVPMAGIVDPIELEHDGQRFEARFTPSLEPRVVDASGEPATLASGSAAAARWGDACAYMAREAGHLRSRFLAAMLEGRRWLPGVWRDNVLGHPLLALFAQSVLWGQYDRGKLVATFRVSEDLSLADAGDQPYELGSVYAFVGVVHPVELPREQVDRWSALFAEYEIVQAIDQLGRPVYRGEFAPEAFVGREFAGRRLYTLRERGWKWLRTYGKPAWGARRDWDGHATSFEFAPGFHPGVDAPTSVRRLTTVSVSGAPTEVAVTEIMSDLAWLTR